MLPSCAGQDCCEGVCDCGRPVRSRTSSPERSLGEEATGGCCGGGACSSGVSGACSRQPCDAEENEAQAVCLLQTAYRMKDDANVLLQNCKYDEAAVVYRAAGEILSHGPVRHPERRLEFARAAIELRLNLVLCFIRMGDADLALTEIKAIADTHLDTYMVQLNPRYLFSFLHYLVKAFLISDRYVLAAYCMMECKSIIPSRFRACGLFKRVVNEAAFQKTPDTRAPFPDVGRISLIGESCGRPACPGSAPVSNTERVPMQVCPSPTPATPTTTVTATDAALASPATAASTPSSSSSLIAPVGAFGGGAEGGGEGARPHVAPGRLGKERDVAASLEALGEVVRVHVEADPEMTAIIGMFARVRQALARDPAGAVNLDPTPSASLAAALCEEGSPAGTPAAPCDPDNAETMQAYLLGTRDFGPTLPPGTTAPSGYGIACAGARGCGRGAAHALALRARQVPSTLQGALVDPSETRIYNCTYSRDGTRMVTSGQEWLVRVYDTTDSAAHVETGTAMRPLQDIATHRGRWTVTCSDISGDNRWVLYTSISPTVYLADLHDEERAHIPLSVSDEWCGVWTACFSPDATQVAASTSSNSLHLFDIETGAGVYEVPSAHTSDANTLAFTDASGATVATGGDDTYVHLWDVRAAAKLPIATAVGHVEGITHLDAKGDGYYLLSNGKDQCAKLWDIRMLYPPSEMPSLTHLGRRFPGWDYMSSEYPGQTDDGFAHPDDCSLATYRGHGVLMTLIHAKFSPLASTGQRYVYSGSVDGAVFIWHIGGSLHSVLRPGNPSQFPIVRDCHWHPHEARLVAGTFRGELLNWVHPS